MYRNKKILAIIPARGGSKGLPGKNIKELLGKPLIGWTIEQAKKSKLIDDIYISTDSKEIAEVAQDFGVLVSELRPAYLATDTSSSIDFIIYTLNLLKSKNKFYDYLILLEPTSPLRDVEDINNCLIKLIETPYAESIVSVCKVESFHPVYLTKLENGFLRQYIKRDTPVRRQDLETLYFFEGTIYASSIEGIENKKMFYHEKCLGHIVPKWKSFEIDELVDFSIIESIMKLKLEGNLKDI
jgi:CMP-N,N'-diacetyllegionaminic acid synthase